MGLAEYDRKRHFNKTSEPVGRTATKKGWSYVIQKHDASRLHYDFRLEMDGVLKSWAVPKGPSLDPSVKRLAVQVEDHPVAYGSFEGTIPEGEYGGGTVMLWDRGDWEPIGDPEAGYRQGKLKFVLHGEKLHGGWTLVRTHRSGSSEKSPQWLLIKERDDEALPMEQGDIVESSPLSVASERDLDEIANGKSRVWSSGKSVKENTTRSAKAVTAKKAATKKAATKKTRVKSKAVGSANVAEVLEDDADFKQTGHDPLPRKIDVQLATLTDQPPEGDDWVHEIKFDGYRMICRIDGSDVQFLTRNHNDWTKRLKDLAAVASKLPCQQAILDGEVVVMQADGTTDFQSLQNAFRDSQTDAMKYYVFDLLHWNGHNLTQLPLEERKVALQKLLDNDETREVLRFSEHVTGQGDDFKQQACRLHLEGMISKRRDQPYRPGRGTDWVKVKCSHDDEFVIGGYTDPAGARAGFGALLVGSYDDAGEFKYAGKVGTGFDAKQLKQMHAKLKLLEQDKSPFVDLTRKTGAAKNAHWVQAVLVGQFKYGSQTRDKKLRHASFQGLREDKPARDVNNPQPVPVSEISPKKSVKKSTTKTKDVKQAKSKPKSVRKIVTEQTSEQTTKPAAGSEIPAYDAAGESFAGVRFTHPQRVLFPESNITKLDIAQYYYAVADWILPQLSHRPLVLVRCPEGPAKECFYQKHPGVGTPKNLRQIPIKESSRTENYLVVDDRDGLISLMQLGALEIHAWGSREDQLEKPDRLIFDLDPDPEVSWKRMIDAARNIRDFLQQLGLESFVKTTGGKGLHVVVPIERRHEWPEAKAFCKDVADLIVQADPASFTSNMSKAARHNKIFVDYLRNGRGATAVVAYSTRARDHATVAMPLAWNELNVTTRSDHFTIRNAMDRLNGLKRDPWEAMTTTRQSLAGPIKAVRKLLPGGAT